jgi:ABC-type dipeptide/oligopeptide/nickel transport system permease component
VVTPHFVWAIFFILLFSLRLKLFPTGGWETPQQWIMPVVVYALGPMAIIARYTRTSVIEVIRSDYVRTARAKGLSEYNVVMKHVMKNAMLPMVTVFGPLIPDMITGSIFVESIFRVPGLGKFWVSSTLNRDYPMIIGLTLLWAVLIAVTYLITDLIYVKLDPRVRLK